MTGYVMDFKEMGTFSPDGKVNMTDIASHNKAIETAELAAWAKRPQKFVGYVTLDHTWPIPSKDYKQGTITTWLGTPLGTIYHHKTHRNNLGARITTIRIHGNNGASYHGSYGSDNGDFCRIRKYKD